MQNLAVFAGTSRSFVFADGFLKKIFFPSLSSPRIKALSWSKNIGNEFLKKSVFWREGPSYEKIKEIRKEIIWDERVHESLSSKMMKGAEAIARCYCFYLMNWWPYFMLGSARERAGAIYSVWKILKEQNHKKICI